MADLVWIATGPYQLPTPEARAVVRRLIEAYQNIVFTNGCFDRLHPGHIDTLRFASSFGVPTIVGVNSDLSATKLKGRKPLFNIEERMYMIQALRHIAVVIEYQEETPIELIKSLLPRKIILVKGADTPEPVAGRAEVESHGGSVHLAPIKRSWHTSQLV